MQCDDGTEPPQRGRDLPVNLSAARSEKGPTPAFAAVATYVLKWRNLDLQLRRRRCLQLVVATEQSTADLRRLLLGSMGAAGGQSALGVKA